jgi:hypothetical protein
LFSKFQSSFGWDSEWYITQDWYIHNWWIFWSLNQLLKLAGFTIAFFASCTR